MLSKETGCWCHECNKNILVDGWLPYNMSLMILCPKCGCKRCPHASDHILECTGSNDPGQEGSVYRSPLTFKITMDGIPAVTDSDWKKIEESSKIYSPEKMYPEIGESE